MTQLCPNCGASASSEARSCEWCNTSFEAEITAPTTPTGSLPNEITLQNGRYVIEGRLGQGGMGAVYVVRDQHVPGRRLAIKEMSTAGLTKSEDLKQATENFQSEAALLGKLEHRNLTHVTDYFEERSRAFVAMDLVEGETLATLLKQRTTPFPVQDVVEWGRQLCNVLSYLHTQTPPIIFRDLKPSNIMVTRDGNIKLIDFGIARHFKPGKQADTEALGTPGYAPLEQYGLQTTPRSDIYALGVTLHELLTRHSPAETPFPFPFPSAHKLNPQVPKSLSDVLAKAVAKVPSARWSSAAEFREALEKSVPEIKLARLTAPRSPGELPRKQTQVLRPEDMSESQSTRMLLPAPIQALLRIILRPLVWLMPYSRALFGLLVLCVLAAVMLFASCGPGGDCDLQELGNVTGAMPFNPGNMAGVIQGIALLVAVIGGVMAYLFGPNPKVSRPPRYKPEPIVGRRDPIAKFEYFWNDTAGTTQREPIFVFVHGKRGAGKSTVLRYFFLEQATRIETAAGMKRSNVKSLPYQYVLWIDCAAGTSQGFRVLAGALPPLLRTYYHCQHDERAFERQCCRYLERVNLALFLDHLDLSNPPESLGIWDQLLRDLAKRRSARLSVWIAANSQDIKYLESLGQQDPKWVKVEDLKKAHVIEIARNQQPMLDWTKTRLEKYAKDNWNNFHGDIGAFLSELRSQAAPDNLASDAYLRPDKNQE